MEMGKGSPLPTPSAPPYSPPLSPLPPSSPLTFPPPHEKFSTVTTNTQPLPWSTGLCGCCHDFHSCCLTCWCPCITFGRIAEMVDRGSTSCGVSGALYMLIMCATGCCCMYSCFYRSKLRGQFFLKETPCTDCCVHCCCQPCALCQEYRQLKHQDLDMSIGWYGNMVRKKRVTTAPPEVEGDMVRYNI